MDGWEKKSLGELCKFQRGLTYGKSDEVDLSGNVVLRANNVDLATHTLNLSDLRYISDSVSVPATKKVRRGSLLICTASGSKSHLGKVAYVDDDYGYAFGGFMGQITPDAGVNGRYVFHALTSPAYKGFIEALSDGLNINNLKFDDLRQFQMRVPNVAEQRRIVTILDEAFEGIAIAKANAETSLRNVRELFKSHAKALFLAGAQRWPANTLDRFATNLDSKRIPITKEDRKAGQYPYYGASGIVDYVAEYIFDGDALLISEDGANLLARSTPIAFSVSGNYWVNNHAHILKFDHMATQRFVECFLETIPLDDYITGAAQPKLNQKALNSIPIPLPDTVDERRQIVDRLDSLSEQCELLLGSYAAKLDALDELKKSLLNQAFSGQLTAKAADKEVAELA